MIIVKKKLNPFTHINRVLVRCPHIDKGVLYFKGVLVLVYTRKIIKAGLSRAPGLFFYYINKIAIFAILVGVSLVVTIFFLII